MTKWNVLDFCWRRDQRRDVRRASVQLLSLDLNGDDFVRSSNLHIDVHRSNLGDRGDEIVDDGVFKAGRGDGNLISSGDDLRRYEKAPAESVLPLKTVTFVFLLVIVILASGTRAPVGSSTCPRIVALVFCAYAAP